MHLCFPHLCSATELDMNKWTSQRSANEHLLTNSLTISYQLSLIPKETLVHLLMPNLFSSLGTVKLLRSTAGTTIVHGEGMDFLLKIVHNSKQIATRSIGKMSQQKCFGFFCVIVLFLEAWGKKPTEKS